MKNIKRLSVTFVLTFLVVWFGFVGTTDLASESVDEEMNHPVAEVSVGANGIAWTPKVGYTSLVLTVSKPDGTVFSRTFGSGSSPYLGLTDNNGNYFSDGSYTYELRVIPFVEKKVRTTEYGDDDITGLKNEEMVPQKALTQSGGFYVQGGAFVSGYGYESGSGLSRSQDELSRVQDFVIADDLIVQGSACIGFDCVNGYNFGFDTIVLRENNLRIFFDDTSTTGSFPSNDWRIIINDSANGGASYYGVEDATAGRRVFTLEAGAPAHSLYVDDGGRVGFGTSTPVLDMHAVSGNTPSLRLEQDGSSGFTPQTWDIAGNEANFFIRDVTSGSRLPFRIRPGAPTSSIDIASSGNVGFGTASPAYPIHLLTNSSTNATFVAERTSGAKNFVNATDSFAVFGAINDYPVRIVTNNSWRMQLNTDNTLNMRDGGSYNGTWNPASSRELKENIQNLKTDEAFEALDGLNPVKFNYKAHKDEARVGFIAEDVPELVAMKGRKTLGTPDILAVLTKVVQEQQKTISELKQEIAEFKKKK